MGSSFPPLVPQGCSQGSWHSAFQSSTALECGHAVQSCPDELLCQLGFTGKPHGAGRKILHLGAAAWSKPVQLWGHTPGSALRGKLRLVQWWPSPGLLHHLSPLSPSTMPAPCACGTKGWCHPKASVPAGPPGAMSNDPPPPYPGGPSAPLIEEKHGPPSAPGTGGVPAAWGDIAKQTAPMEV